MRSANAVSGMEPALEPTTVLCSATSLTESTGITESRRVEAGARRWTTLVPRLPRIELVDRAHGVQRADALVVLSVLAEGGMGRVLLAKQPTLEREVAVKMPKDASSVEEVDSLVREALVAGALDHPSIVPVYALGVSDEDRPVLVMKRVDGVNWGALLDDPEHSGWSTHLNAEGDRLDANIDILIAICRALELAHRRGLLHRDIKPANVMLGRFGEVYLVDWGLATAIGGRESGAVGTPGYMAPEMATGDELDETTDVYLLGATLHRVLTGKPRHRAAEVGDAILAATLSAPFTYALAVPASLADLCNRACAASKLDRPRSVQAFREELVTFKRRRGAIAIGGAAQERLRRLERLLARTENLGANDVALAYRLAAEARFGFEQSLEQFPTNADARSGSVRAVELLVELELRQGNVETAAAHLQDVYVTAGPLAARVEAMRRERGEQLAEHAGLLGLERELDSRIGWRAQWTLAVSSLVLQSALMIGASFSSVLLSRTALIVAPVLTLAVVCVVAVAFRRQLATNAFSRRFVAMYGIVSLSCLMNSALAIAHDTPLMTMLSSELLLFTVLALAFGSTLIPRMVFAAPAFFVAMVATECFPVHAPSIWCWTSAAAVSVMFWAFWSHAQRPRFTP
jgi:serine/threonine-protein kinase